MPFIDDTGIRTENQRGPILSAFAIVLDQIERMVLLNMAWTANLLPALVALLFPELPPWLRASAYIISGVLIIPSTGTFFRLMHLACNGELLRMENVRDAMRELTWPSWRVLLPLYGAFVCLLLLARWTAPLPALFLVNVAAQLAILLLAVTSLYWCPIFAEDAQASALKIVKRSVEITWRYPVATLALGLFALFVWVLGVVSIAGLLLIAPVLSACLQTQHYRSCTGKRQS